MIDLDKRSTESDPGSNLKRTEQVVARRNALLANWLSIHLKRNNAVATTAEVIQHAEPGKDDDILCDEILKDLKDEGSSCDRDVLRNKMRELLTVAAEQLAGEDRDFLQ